MPLFFLIIFLFSCIQLLAFVYMLKPKIKKVVFVVFFIVYITGFFITNGAVKDSCQHVTCENGWYSKENKRQRTVAILWVFSPFIMGMVASGKDFKDK